jgi:hypothetical protein
LYLLPINATFPHDYTHFVARFCNSNGIKFETFCSWYSGKSNTPDNFAKWKVHYDNLHKFLPVSLARMKSVMAVFYPHIKKDVSYRNFTQTFLLPDENITEIKTIDQTNFKTNKKYIIHTAGMGSGKTAQTISYLDGESNFIWLAPNKALASNAKKRFDDENIDITHYLEISTAQKQQGELNNHDKIITVLNSHNSLRGRV